jgi:very-short-patch-repair endonuclease
MGYYGNRELLERARTLRSSMTKAEIILWSRLRSKQVEGFKFRRQQPLLDYIVDFYCHKLKLIIEVDGDFHSQNNIPKYDQKRDNILRLNGYQILRLSNFEVETEINLTISKIQLYIHEILSPSRGDHKMSDENIKNTRNLSPSQGDHRGSAK